MPQVPVLCAIQREHADPHTAGGHALTAGQPQEHTSTPDRTDGGQCSSSQLQFGLNPAVATSLRNICNSGYPALPVSFGGDTKSRQSFLSGVYARGSKRPLQSALECVTVVDATTHSKLLRPHHCGIGELLCIGTCQV